MCAYELQVQSSWMLPSRNGSRRKARESKEVELLVKHSEGLSLHSGTAGEGGSSGTSDGETEPDLEGEIVDEGDHIDEEHDDEAHGSSELTPERFRRLTGSRFAAAADAVSESVASNGLRLTPTSALAAALASISEPPAIDLWPLASTCRAASKAAERTPSSAMQARASWASDKAHAALSRALALYNETSEPTSAHSTCAKEATHLAGVVLSTCAASPLTFTSSADKLFRLCISASLDPRCGEEIRSNGRSAAARTLVGARSANVLKPSAIAAHAMKEASDATFQKGSQTQMLVGDLFAACMPAAFPHPSSAGLLTNHAARKVQQRTLSRSGVSVGGFRRFCAALEALAGSEQAVASNDMVDAVSRALESTLATADASTEAPEAVEAALSCAEQMQRCLTSIDETEGSRKLHGTFQTAVTLLRHPEKGVANAAERSLLNLIRSCIVSSLVKQAASSKLHGSPANADSVPLLSVVQAVEQALSARYADAWEHSTTVAHALVKRLGTAAATLAPGVIEALGEMEGSNARSALAACLAHCGTGQVLAVLPIDVGEAMESSEGVQGRLWLIELIRKHAQGERASLFEERLLPMADECRQVAISSQGSKLGKRAEGIEEALWSTLASILQGGSESISDYLAQRLEWEARHGKPAIRRSVERTARVLGSEHRASNLGGLLQTLVEKYKKSGSADAEAVAALAKGRGEVEARGVIAHLAQSATKGHINSMQAMLSLCASLISALDGQTLHLAIRAAAAGAAAADLKTCKQAYGFLAKLLEKHTVSSDLRIEAMSSHAQLICSAATVKTAKAATKARLSFLCEFLPIIAAPAADSEAEQNLASVASSLDSSLSDRLLGQAIFACKEPNSQARRLAYLTIERFASVRGVENTFNAIMGGVSSSSSSRMAAAALFSAARLVYKRSEPLQARCESTLPLVLHLAVSAPSKEVSKAALGFIKVACVSLPKETVRRWLDDITSALTSLAATTMAQKAKGIIVALLKRLGENDLLHALPSGHEKLVKNLSKQHRRAQRIKADNQGLPSYSLGQERTGSETASHTGASYKSDNALSTRSGRVSSQKQKSGFEELAAASKSAASVRKKSKNRAHSNATISLPEEDDDDDLLNESKMRKLKSSAQRGPVLPPGFDNANEEPALQHGEDGKLHLSYASGKRKRLEQGEGQGDAESYNKGTRASIKMNKPISKKQKSGSYGTASVEGTESGDSRKRGVHHASRFRAKSGKGDKSAAGGVQPYAYWPLDRKLLAKRRGRQKKATRELALATGIRK
jgi:ribosomal RNA-processing protein 12